MNSKNSSRLMYKYGITEEEYQLLLRAQKGACYICRRIPTGRRLGVDHRHVKRDRWYWGKEEYVEFRRSRVRGLLCWRCNYLLGKGGDDPSLFYRAYRYLRDPPARRILHRVKTSS